MTDRGEEALELSRDALQIGPSTMVWKGDSLEVQINEISTPHTQRVKGTVTIHPTALTDQEMLLTDDGAHVWRPFAPTARIEVALNRPGWMWYGHGYFDANFGARALEADFDYWTWGRFPLKDGSACFYDLERRDRSTRSTGVGFKADGTPHAIPLPHKGD